MNSQNILYTDIIQEMTDYLIVLGFKPKGKTVFNKESSFGNWSIKICAESKKDKSFTLSYKIGYRINEIENICKMIFDVKPKDMRTAVFDLGMLIGLSSPYEQYVTVDVEPSDIIIDFDYHYKKFLDSLFHSYDRGSDIIFSTFDDGILSMICNYSVLKKTAYFIWKKDFSNAAASINSIPNSLLAQEDKTVSLNRLIELEKQSENSIK